ncbi:hypothetical protein O3P69_010658 [Scylla paramamosain]|uniref:Uncharacterized protein n=1 Tax=Scylla paramamosain TaxID=85552 RepID=A0AAW0TEE4_SCYPA
MDNDSSSEDEVFFGPVTTKEKRIAARYHGRKTLILPQRNPLYRRWSTTHIPSAPTARKDDLVLTSPSNSDSTSDSLPQHCHPHESSQCQRSTDESPLLSHDVRDSDHSRISSKSVRDSLEGSHQGMSFLSLTESSCYSSIDNFADDERSISSTKLSQSSSLQSETSGGAQRHEPYLVTSHSHFPVSPKIPTTNSKENLLQCHSLIPIMPEESAQENFSSHHCEQSSVYRPAADTEKLVSLSCSASADLKTSACFNELSDDSLEISVRSLRSPRKSDDCEVSNNLRKSPPRMSETSCSSKEFNCNVSKFLSTLRETDSKDISSIPKESYSNHCESSNNERKSNCLKNEPPSFLGEPDCRVSKSCITDKEFNVTRNEYPIPREPDATVCKLPNISREPHAIGSEYLNISRETDATDSESLNFAKHAHSTGSESPNISIDLDTVVSHPPSIPTKADATGSQSPNISTETDAAGSQSPNISTETDAAGGQSPSIPTETDAAGSQSPSIPTEADATDSQSPSIPTEADATDSQSPSIPTEADATDSQSPSIPIEADAAGSQSPSIPTEADATDSQSPSIPIEADVAGSQSPSIPTEADATDSQSPSIPTEADATGSQSSSISTEADAAGSQSPRIPRESSTTSSDGILREPNCCSSRPECYPTYSDCSLKVLEHSSMETDCNLKEPPSNPRGPDCSLTELHISLNNPDGSPKEPVKKELDNNHMELLTSARITNDSSMDCDALATFPASPRFNDTLEEIELFLKYGMNYGEEGTSPLHGYQGYNTPPSHTSGDPECNLEPPCIPKEAFSNPSMSPNDLKKPSGNSKESHYSSSELDYKTIEPDSSLSICPVESVSSHGEPNHYSMEPLASLEKPGDGHKEPNASTSFSVSPKFIDSVEVEQIQKYRMDHEEKDTFLSHGTQERTTPTHSSCSNEFQSSLEFNQTSTNFVEVVHVKDKKSCGIALGRKELCGTPLQIEGTTLCSTSRSRTRHGSNVQSLPSLTKSAAQLGLTKPTQRVTPTSRAPLSQPHSQPAREGRITTMKTTPTLKVVKSSSNSHTPTTSRMQQSQASQIKLQLDSPTVTLTPRAPGLPPHPQRKGVVGHFAPKKTQTSILDRHDRRAVWHNSVASPLAKELRNNPPPPFITNVKSSSCSSGRWQPSTPHSCQSSIQPPHASSNNFSKGGRSQKVTAEGTLSPHMSLDGEDDQVLPVTNYKPGKSVILEKKNKENIKRPCCKTTPILEAKVIKHAGRLKVAKCQSASQTRQSGRTSLMEVSIHQAVYSD